MTRTHLTQRVCSTSNYMLNFSIVSDIKKKLRTYYFLIDKLFFFLGILRYRVDFNLIDVNPEEDFDLSEY